MAYDPTKMAQVQSSAPENNTYDSDEDLPDDTQAKLKALESDPTDLNAWSQADAIRKSAWDNAGTYPKLKKLVKGAVWGDTHGDT